MTTSHAAEDRVLGGERVTDGVWTHLGKMVLKSVVLPAASVDTNALVPSAAQQMIGSYVQTVGWTLPSSNVWTETPIQASLVSSGSPTRIEFNVLVGCPTKGQRIFWGIMVNGVAPSVPLGAMDCPENNFGTMAVGVYYVTPQAGAGRIGLGLYGPSGSQIFSAFPSTLYVTEQKR
jgi:hypothetical protein